MGNADTRPLFATIADAPQLVLTVPDRVSVAPGKSAKIKVVVARMDDGDQPLEIGAEKVDPVTVEPGGTLAEVKVTADGRASVTLVGKVGGKVIGNSHPMPIEA